MPLSQTNNMLCASKRQDKTQERFNVLGTTVCIVRWPGLTHYCNNGGVDHSTVQMSQGMWEVGHSGTSAANRGVTPLQSHARCWVHTTAASSLQPPLTNTAHSNYPVSEEKRREEKKKASSSSSSLSHGLMMVVSPVFQVSRPPDSRRAVSLAPALDRCRRWRRLAGVRFDPTVGDVPCLFWARWWATFSD